MKTLLKYIYNLATFSEATNLLESFRKLYEKEFIDENEREDFNVITSRVIEKAPGFDPYTFIILSCDETSKVVYGGLIGDWYENSKTIHLTYLVVDKTYRCKHIGRDLVKIGLEKIKQIINQEKGIILTNVYLETNIPGKTIVDNFDIGTRLKIFSKLGAKWIDIPYVQPPLGKEKNQVKNLFLCVFPDIIEDENIKNEESVKRSQIKNFLLDLYKGLDANSPEDKTNLKLMIDALEITDSIILKRIPMTESNSFTFNKCAVAFHFIQGPELSDEPINDKHCFYFHSYETDLLNFRYQSDPPFSTHLELKTADNTLEIEFPEIHHFTSEGRVETVFCTAPLLRTRYSLSSTWFGKSKIRIWHLVLSPLPNFGFTEHDLIKLATVFGSRQEESDLLSKTRFLKNGQQYDNISDFVASHSDKLKNHLIKSGTGLIEIESKGINKVGKKTELLMDNIFKYLTLLRKDNTSEIDIEKEIKSGEQPIEFLKIICGILMGIFDFERMGVEEIEDTLKPIEASESYFTTLSRGNLLCIGKDEDLLEQGTETFGINPYLLIPSCLLVYNEYILKISKFKLDITLNHEYVFRINKAKHNSHFRESEDYLLPKELSVDNTQRELVEKIYIPGFIEHYIKKNHSVDLKNLNDIRENIEHNLNKNLLENIFHYPTEELILEKGYKQRQLNDIKSDIKLKLKELSDIIDTKNSIKEGKARGLSAALLAFISFLTLQPILMELFLKINYQNILLILIAIGFAVLFYKLTIKQK